MKKIEIEIPDGKKAEWVNGVLTLVDDQPIKYKYKVGDKVRSESGQIYTITGQFAMDGEPWYGLTNEGWKAASAEKWLELVPHDITEIIKTFEDAYLWCKKNNVALVEQYHDARNVGLQRAADLHAYLKLRIITCALNEGWEPSTEVVRFEPDFTYDHQRAIDTDGIFGASSSKLMFKKHSLAVYAAEQFRDLYADFCGCKKSF